MTSRNITPPLIDSLLANDAFTYVHYVKFEKPKPSGWDGAIAGIATDYTYITDAPYNLDWDDGEVDGEGIALGPQTYIANKLISIGGVQETTEARASTMSLKLSSIALGTMITTEVEVDTGSSPYRLKTSIDLVEAGFREGDKVEINGAGNSNLHIIIEYFTPADGTPETVPSSWAYFT